MWTFFSKAREGHLHKMQANLQVHSVQRVTKESCTLLEITIMMKVLKKEALILYDFPFM
jgi:hypothetical protein